MSTLSKIVTEAKRLRKAHPNKYKRLSNPWGEGYIPEAARRVKRGFSTKPAKKRVAKKATKPKPKKRKRKRSVKGKAPRKIGTIEQAVGRKHRRRRKARARKVSGSTRRRRVGGNGGGISTGTLLGIGALGLVGYLLLKDDKPQTNYPAQLPALQQTGNVTRDQQSSNLVNWAIAAGVAITAITSLIDRLNNSSDNEVKSIYDDVSTTGDLGAWV